MCRENPEAVGFTGIRACVRQSQGRPDSDEACCWGIYLAEKPGLVLKKKFQDNHWVSWGKTWGVSVLKSEMPAPVDGSGPIFLSERLGLMQLPETLKRTRPCSYGIGIQWKSVFYPITIHLAWCAGGCWFALVGKLTFSFICVETLSPIFGKYG